MSYECLAFSYFQGIPQQLLYDNMRPFTPIVTKHSVKQIRFNKKFEDFLSYYGIIPRLVSLIGLKQKEKFSVQCPI